MNSDKCKGKKKREKKNKRQYKYEKTKNTLDVCHEKQLDKFNKEYNNLNKFTKELKLIKKRIKIKNNNNSNNDTDNGNDNVNDTDNGNVNNLYNLKKKEKELIYQINLINSKRDEIDYLTNTSEILFNYYDSVENNEFENSNMKNILDFFKTEQTHEYEDENYNKNDKNDNDDNNNRSKLLETYLSYTDKNYINNNLICNSNICYYCKSKKINNLPHDGLLYCNDCSTVEYIITDNEKPGYKEPPKEISYFSYNRINHFNEWLAQSQGKETTDIPEEIFDKIYIELKKNKIDNMAVLDYEKIKSILKKTKVNKYYEHIPYILNRITGKLSPQLSPELEEKLRNMFRDIQGPFIKYSPPNRKNFLSYSYVIHKFLEILGEDKYIKYFPLLKSREKLHQQEIIFEKICTDLNWQFIKSI
jgi:hypothetical protein